MNSKKQKLLLEFLISSTDTFAMCQGILDPEYFDPEYRSSVDFILEYYEQYSSTPSPIQLEAETDVVLKSYEVVGLDEIEYCSSEIEVFCKRRALERATLALPKLIDDGDYGGAEEIIKQAVSVSLNKSLGLRYYDTVAERLERMLHENVTQSTGWTELDDKLFGGISRQELFLVSANSGGGKSITLANLAYSFSTQGLNVLYISLELSQDVVASRFDTIITGFGRRNWKEHISEITDRVVKEGETNGILDVVHMSTGTTAHQIRAFLKEYQLHYGFIPDMLIVDYLDEMEPNEKVSADNVWEKDKRCTSQLRQVGVDYNMYLATASQLNRSAVKASADEHDHSQIAGGISKINISDIYMSIIMTDEMREIGEIVFILLKTRNSDGVGSQIHLKWDSQFLRIRNKTGINFVPNTKNTNTVTQADKLATLCDL